MKHVLCGFALFVCTLSAAFADADSDAAAALALAAARPQQAPGPWPEQAPKPGCACAFTGVCTCGPHCGCAFCSTKGTPHLYADVAAAAFAAKKPLVVGLGCTPPHSANDWQSCEVQSLAGYSGTGVIVSRPGTDWLVWVATLKPGATQAEVRSVLRTVPSGTPVSFHATGLAPSVLPPRASLGFSGTAHPAASVPYPAQYAPAPMQYAPMQYAPMKYAAPMQQQYAAPMYAAPKFSGPSFGSAPVCVGGR